MILGIILYSIGIVITIRANIGYAPWDVFHIGIGNTLGLTIGTVSIIMGIIILGIVVLCGEKFGLGTVTNILLIGAFLDIFLKINIIPKMDNFIWGVVMLIAGLFVIALGSYFYMGSGFGSGPRDNLMVVLARKTKIPAGVCRSAIELLATLIGWLLGGMVGAGTVISIIGIGFCIQIIFKLFKFDVTAVRHESLKDTYTILAGARKNKK